MKRCPQCNRTYTDDALSFCLDDGSPLVSTAAPSSFDPSATVQYPSSRDTSPQPTIAYPSQMPTPPPPSQPVPPPAPPAWSPMPPSTPQKRSVWPWILGIGAVLVFMGIGVAILIFAIASVTNSNNNNGNSNTNRQANRNSNSNSNSNNTNSATNENSNSRSTLTSFTDDFSDNKLWGTGPSQYGNIFYQDEEYHMRATKGGYIVMYSPDKKDYYDENATVRVGLRSIDGNSPTSGYGLTVHGEKKTGNLEDYGFLIYNGDEPKYKIVLHKGGSETKVVDWTPSSTIRTGTNPNQLEVRIRGTKMDFYINGQFVTSIVDEANYQKGRVGFYTSDVGEVAFDDLEISK